MLGSVSKNDCVFCIVFALKGVYLLRSFDHRRRHRVLTSRLLPLSPCVMNCVFVFHRRFRASRHRPVQSCHHQVEDGQVEKSDFGEERVVGHRRRDGRLINSISRSIYTKRLVSREKERKRGDVMIDVNTIFPCESSEEERERERRNRRPLSFLRMDSLLRRICFLKGCFLLYTYERNRSILSTHLSVQNALLVRLATEVKVCTLDAVEGPLDSKPFKLEKSREEWGVGEKRFLFSRRARARCYDSMHIHALVFSTALRGFSIALFSYPSFSFIISQLSTHLSFRFRPNPSRLFSIFSPFVTTHYKKNAFFFASSSSSSVVVFTSSSLSPLPLLPLRCWSPVVVVSFVSPVPSAARPSLQRPARVRATDILPTPNAPIVSPTCTERGRGTAPRSPEARSSPRGTRPSFFFFRRTTTTSFFFVFFFVFFFFFKVVSKAFFLKIARFDIIKKLNVSKFD